MKAIPSTERAARSKKAVTRRERRTVTRTGIVVLRERIAMVKTLMIKAERG